MSVDGNKEQHSSLDLYYKLGSIGSSVESLKEYMKTQFESLDKKIESHTNRTDGEIAKIKIEHSELKKKVDSLYIKVFSGGSIGVLVLTLLIDYFKGLF